MSNSVARRSDDHALRIVGGLIGPGYYCRIRGPPSEAAQLSTASSHTPCIEMTRRYCYIYMSRARQASDKSKSWTDLINESAHTSDDIDLCEVDHSSGKK
jgi:hypothetical protein